MARSVWPITCVTLALLAFAGTAGARDAPETTITAGPIGRTGDSSPSFAFESSDPDATFECSLDGAGFSSCTSPHTFAGVTESPHTFAVRSVNAAGEADPTPAERSFSADESVDATISAARDQVQDGAHIHVALRIRADERLRATVRGTIQLDRSSFELKPARKHVDPGRTVMRLRPAADDAATIAKALADGERAKAHVRVRLADTLDNQLKVPLAVSLSPATRR